MVFDPSHTGGTREKVQQITTEANAQGFDGLIIEVHPDPEHALTDAKQQLNWLQFDKLLATL